MMSRDLKKLTMDCVGSTFYCALSTLEDGRPWICPVSFATDASFNIYFVSNPGSRHMRNIRRNPKVAIAIYTTAQRARGPKIGVQLEGEARLVRGSRDIELAYRTYFGRLPTWEETTVEYFKEKNCEWPFVKVTPRAIYYFNSGLFNDERKRVI